MIATRRDPLLLVAAKFIWQELATTRMLVVIAVNLSVTLEADGNCVPSIILAALSSRNDVVDLHLHAAEPVADTASAMDLNEQLRNLTTINWHRSRAPLL